MAGIAEVLVLVVLIAGCSTTYQPRPSGRVGIVVRGAAPMYIKDGREHPIGPFSGDLEELVAGTPAAVAHARRAHTRFLVGTPTYVLGAASVIVGVVVLSGPVGWIVIGAGASSMALGLGSLGSAVLHAIDAVNLRNDDVSARK